MGAIPARPGPILVPSVPFRIGPGRAETDFLATADKYLVRPALPIEGFSGSLLVREVQSTTPERASRGRLGWELCMDFGHSDADSGPDFASQGIRANLRIHSRESGHLTPCPENPREIHTKIHGIIRPLSFFLFSRCFGWVPSPGLRIDFPRKIHAKSTLRWRSPEIMEGAREFVLRCNRR